MGCALCQEKLAAEANDQGPLECVDCGSSPEDRSFAWFFRSFVHPPPGAKILDVAPSPALLRYLPRYLKDSAYTAIGPVRLPEADYLKPPHRFMQMAVTRLSFSEASFDFIICNRVLSYVRSDFQAMTEIHRCLSSRGIAFLSVPLVPGKSTRVITEPHRPTGSEREWIYGDDYFERLEAAGFFVHRESRAAAGAGPCQSAVESPPSVEQVLAFKFRDTMEGFLRELP